MKAMTAGELEPGQVFTWFCARWEAVRFVWRKVPGYVHPRTFLLARPAGTDYEPSEFPLDEAVLLVEPPRLVPLADASAEDVANAGKIMRRVPRGRLTNGR